MAWILCVIMLILFNGMTEATTASAPSPDSFSPTPTPPSPKEPDLWAPPPPREYIPPDDYPREGMRWCRDRNYSCYGTVMQCSTASTQYCPLDQCVMDCAACELTCVHPSPNTTPTRPPPPPTPTSPSPPDPYQNDDFWTPALPVYPDDFPVKGTRWCRDIGSDCFGNSMICNSQYCPLDQCYMDCNECGLVCRVPWTEPPWNSPPFPPSPPTPETPPPISALPASSPSSTQPPISTPLPSPASSPPPPISSPSPSPASPTLTIPQPPSAPTPAPSPPPTKPPPRHSHKKRTRSKRATCKNKKFPRCYGRSFVCPRSCRRTCKVNCISCKPVCPKL